MLSIVAQPSLQNTQMYLLLVLKMNYDQLPFSEDRLVFIKSCQVHCPYSI